MKVSGMRSGVEGIKMSGISDEVEGRKMGGMSDRVKDINIVIKTKV